MNILAFRKFAFIFSGLLVALAVFSLLTKGPQMGPDFTGDAILEGEFENIQDLSKESINTAVEESGVEAVSVVLEENRVRLRTLFLNEEDHTRLLEHLNTIGTFHESSFTSTGPTLGKQLRENAIYAILITIFAIVIFIAWAFRRVSKPVSSWIYGIIAVIALIHDVIIPAGIFSYLGIEITALFVTAILTILGFSVHDTIVVFDRVRENLKEDPNEKFEKIVEKSLSQTIIWSINTSLTTVLALTAIYFFGGESTESFSLALIIGIVFGTYSSLFLATPLLVTYEKKMRK